MLSDRLTLAQRRRFGPSSEKYADGYIQLSLFNEAEQEADPDIPEPDMEEIYPWSYKRKKHSGKKEEDDEAFRKGAVPSQRKCGNPIPCSGDHECKVCEWYASCAPGTGIRPL